MGSSFFTLETWKTTALVGTILSWSFAGLSILSAIVAYCATTNADFLKKEPRSLTPAQQEKIKNPASPEAQATQPLPASNDGVVIISVGGMESDAYANQIGAALADNFKIERIVIGTMSNTVPGITYNPNGHDPKPMLDHLERAGIHAKLSPLPYVPIPGSVRNQYSGFLVLLIGPKPAD